MSSTQALPRSARAARSTLPPVLPLVAPDALPTPPSPLLGLIPGEGVGPELLAVVGDVLAALVDAGAAPLELRRGGAIGHEALAAGSAALTSEVTGFCQDLFDGHGALLCGPGAGRFVYDLRRRFDLYCKLVPIRRSPELADVGCIRPEHAAVDIVVVRENVGGIYQGSSRLIEEDGVRRAEHACAYDEGDARRIIRVAVELAARRRGNLEVVVKRNGMPALSRLWEEIAADLAGAAHLSWRVVDVDYAAYRMIHHAPEVDVLVAPNLFGDILGDLGGVLLGSRGLCYSANFSPSGAGVYQTGHGAAFDLAGTDRCNPAAQLLALAMLLRESLRRPREADAIEQALARLWRAGVRTADVAAPGMRAAGTRAFGAEVARAAATLFRADGDG